MSSRSQKSFEAKRLGKMGPEAQKEARLELLLCALSVLSRCT